MHNIEKELIGQGFKKYYFDVIRKMSREVLEDFIEGHEGFTNIAILKLGCPYHPIYKIYYRILH